MNLTDPSGMCYVENWVMHVYNGEGDDLGPDPVKPERWSEIVGDCGKFSIPGQKGSAGAGPGRSIGEAALDIGSGTFSKPSAIPYTGLTYCRGGTRIQPDRHNAHHRIGTGVGVGSMMPSLMWISWLG